MEKECIRAVVDAKLPLSGITIHEVNEKFDEGKILFRLLVIVLHQILQLHWLKRSTHLNTLIFLWCLKNSLKQIPVIQQIIFRLSAWCKMHSDCQEKFSRHACSGDQNLWINCLKIEKIISVQVESMFFFNKFSHRYSGWFDSTRIPKTVITWRFFGVVKELRYFHESWQSAEFVSTTKYYPE